MTGQKPKQLKREWRVQGTGLLDTQECRIVLRVTVRTHGVACGHGGGPKLERKLKKLDLNWMLIMLIDAS
jgi:hypothetical protein